LLCLALTTAALAQPAARQEKAAWEWTAEERIALRTDPAARQARVAQALARREAADGGRRSPLSGNRPSLPLGDSLHGDEHPELFLPTELFTLFTRSALLVDDDVASHFRTNAEKRAASIGLPADLVPTFAAEAREATAWQRQERALIDRIAGGERANRALTAELADVRQQLCAARFAAMTRLRARYGVAFDRFLYTVVAPEAFLDLFGAMTGEEMRQSERGCP
jgi:hypothetical protein